MEIILYEMATGELPFKGDTTVSILSSIMKVTPTSVTEINPDVTRVTPRIDSIVIKNHMVLLTIMAARLLFRDSYVYADGAIREMTIWQLPRVDTERPHGLKYRLFYGYPDRCLVRYDNERGKGDHRHYGGREESYAFASVEQLMADFRMDIERLRGDKP